MHLGELVTSDHSNVCALLVLLCMCIFLPDILVVLHLGYNQSI